MFTVQAVRICAGINARHEYYTTSSCAGRCFLYVGEGVKSTSEFWRCRVSHDIIRDQARYFNLDTVFDKSDICGGGDPIPSIGQFDYKQERLHTDDGSNRSEAKTIGTGAGKEVWLRFEPFILHVCCRSLDSAAELMKMARPSFKNVGLTTWRDSDKYLVAIWGDEGLDMPLSTVDGTSLFSGREDWLQNLVNERHRRNWLKIERFAESVEGMDELPVDEHCYNDAFNYDSPGGIGGQRLPRSFDVIGDVALIHSVPNNDTNIAEKDIDNEHESSYFDAIGEAIMKKNKAIKVVALRTSALGGNERCCGESGIKIIAGIQRTPLISTHSEYGIKCVVDVERTFFSPRMGPERLRICQQVARGEKVLVLFSGCGMDALQIAGRTEASEVVAIELNPVAAECARRGQRMLARNKSVKCKGAAERLKIIEGDVLEILPTLEKHSFDRVLAPRPKEGQMDGDLGVGDCGRTFLDVLLPVIKPSGGECHWYDFAAFHELPTCDRTAASIRSACDMAGCAMEIIHVASVGSVAKRQTRVCVDFRLIENS